LGFHKTSYIGKEGVFAIELESDQKNKGYMTEALNIILDFSFSKLELNRVEATHYILIKS